MINYWEIGNQLQGMTPTKIYLKLTCRENLHFSQVSESSYNLKDAYLNRTLDVVVTK